MKGIIRFFIQLFRKIFTSEKPKQNQQKKVSKLFKRKPKEKVKVDKKRLRMYRLQDTPNKGFKKVHPVGYKKIKHRKEQEKNVDNLLYLKLRELDLKLKKLGKPGKLGLSQSFKKWMDSKHSIWLEQETAKVKFMAHFNNLFLSWKR